MISELLDLADRLEIPTPRVFEPMPVHYFIDLDGEGRILGVTPAFGSTKDKSGEPEIGKEIECPAYFPLAVSEKGEIQAAGGGGKSVAEAGHGDVREIFCTEIKVPKGKPPRISVIEPPMGSDANVLEPAAEPNENANDEDEPSEDDDSDSETKSAKNQHYRHAGWLKQIKSFIESENHCELVVSKALKQFIAAKPRLTDPAILGLFRLPDPAKVDGDATTAEEKKKARDAATKARNAMLKTIAGARFTFRINGELILKNREFRRWWDEAYGVERTRILERLPTGRDGFSRRDDPGSTHLTPVFPNIPKIPGGGTYCPLASFDKAATQSFGLGKHTLSMSLTSTERAAAALKWLLRDKVHNCPLGQKLIAVFWAVPPVKNAKPCPQEFASLLNEPDALQVLDFFRNIHGHSATSPDAAQFYCAILSSPKSRITVRSWHTRTLGRVTESAEKYFRAASLPDVFCSGELRASTIGEMATATIPPKSQSAPPPTVYSRILQTALFGALLPHSFLESALARQALELAKGCAQKKERSDFESRLRARTALIKLYFYSNQKEPKDKPMNEQHHDKQDHPAYLCGCVLALLDKIHNAAHGKSTASSPAGRYYGSASSTPALVFPRLCKLARIHLEKIENKGWACNLDRDLTNLISKFSAEAAWPRTLSLEDQGRFAIGFYYERAPRTGESAGSDSQSNDDSNKS